MYSFVSSPDADAGAVVPSAKQEVQRSHPGRPPQPEDQDLFDGRGGGRRPRLVCPAGRRQLVPVAAGSEGELER